VTPDNWSFVFVAYGFALVVLVAYWCFLARRERELTEGGEVARNSREESGVSEPKPAARGPLP
jgi:hypothetical protein